MVINALLGGRKEKHSEHAQRYILELNSHYDKSVHVGKALPMTSEGEAQAELLKFLLLVMEAGRAKKR